MNGNIDDKLQIVNGDHKTVTATGWLEFETGDPSTVWLWVGLGQGDKKPPANGAVYGEGKVKVQKPAAGEYVEWSCPAVIGGTGQYAKGKADAGAAVKIGNEVYPWGRQVQLKEN
jgi:hypothetical protein